MAGTDTGHDTATEPLATFAQNRQKLLDYAFRSLHTTAETGKQIATAYYGSKPTCSSFEGCSTGGRQSLILAQRFPDDFDGIIAGAPVLNFTGTMISYAKMAQALAAAPIPYGKPSLVAARIYTQCDEKDGLKDGLIDDPRRCDFQPARDLPKCAEGADNSDCFTAGQIGTLEKIHGDVMSQGKRIFPGWPVSSEVAGPMYFGWADPALNAQMGVDYYESVLARMGSATPRFFRLFMVPGMFHCGGGIGCSIFDKLGPVVQWVEKGIAPESIIGSRIVNGKPDRTRPLCPYPQTAKYKGSGSIDDAANFVCK